ncbi:unnamed protein product, partial [Effrenium voratum]
ERRGKKKLGLAGQEGASSFLSQVPEVENDVPFRFMFEVNGPKVDVVVRNACESIAALSLRDMDRESCSQSSHSKESGEVKERDSLLSSKVFRSSSASFLPHVCLCEVPRETPAAMGRQPSVSKLRLAKLSFRNLPYGKLTKACNSASDAENCCMVFMVFVDEEVAVFHDRMEEIEKAILHMTESIPPTRRPVPAVFLLEKKRTDIAKWKQLLQDYEESKGVLLKYGPMGLDDGNTIFEAFASLATRRIHSQEQGFTSKQLWSSNVRQLAWPLVNLPKESALNRSKSAISSVSSASSMGESF